MSARVQDSRRSDDVVRCSMPTRSDAFRVWKRAACASAVAAIRRSITRGVTRNVFVSPSAASPPNQQYTGRSSRSAVV